MSHFLTDVLAAFEQHASLPIFKQLSLQGSNKSWVDISYKECQNDIETAAGHWHATLFAAGLVPSDVVGLWLTGHLYTDLIHIYAVCRAGLVPQVFSVNHAGAGVVDDLISACKGKVLLHDPAFSGAVVHAISVPCICIPSLDKISVVNWDPLPALLAVSDDDVAIIFHTSGTTSGKPKPIPETHRWLKGQQAHWKGVTQGCFETQDVYNQLGSLAHLGSATLLSHLSVSGQCAVQASRGDFDAEEFIAMTKKAGLNRLFLYAPWLSTLLTFAKTNSEVLDTLRGMRQIIYTGASMNPDDEAWMVSQGLPVTLLYATTESCLCLISDLAERSHLPEMRIIPGVECEFVPTEHVIASDSTERTNEEARLYDLFIPAHSSNCPHPTVRNRPPDGHVTGDLFAEARPGRFVFRGRSDDWIRTGTYIGFCDTKAIEDNVLSVCAHLVRSCTVVGHNRPFIVLFVEPVVPPASEEDTGALKARILELTAPFNARLFAHERITDAGHIVVVPSGSLSRTKEKGNIRRKAVQDEFADVLASIYAAS